MTAAQPPAAPQVETTVTTTRQGARHYTRTKVAPRPATGTSVTITPSDKVTTTTKITPQ